MWYSCYQMSTGVTFLSISLFWPFFQLIIGKVKKAASKSKSQLFEFSDCLGLDMVHLYASLFVENFF